MSSIVDLEPLLQSWENTAGAIANLEVRCNKNEVLMCREILAKFISGVKIDMRALASKHKKRINRCVVLKDHCLGALRSKLLILMRDRL